MNIQKSIAAVAVAVLMAAAMPALNWAQDSEDSLDDLISKEVEPRVRVQEKIVRRAEEQARKQAEQAAKQAAKAQEVMIKAASDPNLNFNVVVDTGEIFPLGMKIHEASARVRDAGTSEAREQASKELQAALDEYFEIDMQARSQELEDIRSRLTKLEGQLDRRRQKKEEIINLQLKVALHEADGLGFYSEPQGKAFNFTTPPVAVWDVKERFAAPVAPRIPAPARVPLPTVGVYSSPTQSSPSLPTLRRGSEGVSVRLLQTTLNNCIEPSPEIDVDGDFGPKTEAAVKKFQSQNDLKPSGVVDEKTWEAFGKIERVPPQKK